MAVETSAASRRAPALRRAFATIWRQTVKSGQPLCFTGVKVFSATLARGRDDLGERVTEWLAENRALVIVDVAVTQSSDSAFHCLAITLFYSEKG